MTVFIARRLLLLPLVGIGVTLLIFSLLQLLSPEQRAALYVTDPRQLLALDSIIRTHGLDKPVTVQYVQWLWRVVRGDLGWSETAKMTVARAITTFFPATLELTLYAFVPIIALGIWLGTKSAVHKDKIIDHFSRLFAIGGQSFPPFVWGLLLLMVFYGAFRLFPPGRLSLEANPSVLETLRQDYVRTARAKGLEEPKVINKHARKNAMIPVITLSALLFVGLLNGVVITETIYNYPGIGRWGAGAALQLDAAAVAGFALFSALLLVLGNLTADVLYAWIDPRIRLR